MSDQSPEQPRPKKRKWWRIGGFALLLFVAWCAGREDEKLENEPVKTTQSAKSTQPAKSTQKSEEGTAANTVVPVPTKPSEALPQQSTPAGDAKPATPALAPDPEHYTRVAVALHTVTLCVVKATNSATAKDEDLKYVSDGLFVLGAMQQGLDEKYFKIAESAIDKHIQDVGLEAFCRENKPSLDKAIALAREQYPDELNRSFQDFKFK